MGGEHEAPKKRRPFYQTLTVDVDIDTSVLEENGYHHEEDCPSGAESEYDDTEDNRRQLSDWHDEAHGLTLWTMCPHQPCKILTDDFRSSR